ncbi:MAG: phosphonate metabolism protein/1,5-bisphosphokinase (PRPP-forming) PhnN [Promethearchaeota archaeon]
MVKELPGILFLIVGNSGSGKDTIISEIIKKYPSHLKQIFAPKRYITRKSSQTEKNILITVGKFKYMEENGQFALKWHIYNLDYGIPIEIDDWLKKGNPVIINVSRTIVNRARELYKNIKVVFIDAPLDIIIKRLNERGRENSELLKERIKRAQLNQEFPEADYIIDNSGDLEDAVDTLLNYLLENIDQNYSSVLRS